MREATLYDSGNTERGLLEVGDEILAARAAQGSLDSFQILVVRHRLRVYRVCWCMAGNADDAEDWAQECFVRLYTQLRHYNTARPLLPWMLRVVSNTCINLATKRSRHASQVPLHTLELTLSDGAGSDPAAQVMERVQSQQAADAMQDLPPLLRQAVTLWVQEELTFRELAAVLGVPLPTAASRVRRGLQQMRSSLTVSGVEQQ